MRSRFSAALLAIVASLAGCRRGVPVVEPDRPQLTPDVRVIDTTVHSAALAKDMPLRIIVPADPNLAARELPVVYFLHGAGTNFHDWTNHSNIASFAAHGFVLVFVNAPGSYYIDDLRSARNQYEPYITREVPAIVHAAVPAAARNAAGTAIVGISRGGYGAVVLGLKHPGLYGFIGTLSGALDFTERGFRWKAPIDSGDVQRAFGPMGDATRRENDPFLLLRAVERTESPFFFVACGKNDNLQALSQRFGRQLARQNLPYEAHFAPGGHTWTFWSGQLPALEASLRSHLAATGVADQRPASPGVQ